jgi:DNA invertase Pin-like site-specific DNA recombinase|tara:strand:- start:1854 stop:2507 length:654 start_codon:yes stop_codon:yes gene_type:complete
MKFIKYYRVSTSQQAKSGLGLQAQERDIDLYLNNYAEEPYELLGEFTDVISGKRDDRPELEKAVAQAEATGATLIVSKLDRLSRRVSFIASTLENKKLSFLVATMPNADKFQLHIYAALAEQEREFISLRTKQALAPLKGTGKLGGVRPNQDASRAITKQIADDNAIRVKPIINDMRVAGRSFSYIAEKLNEMGVATANSGRWYDTTVRRYALRNAQ